MSTIQSVRAELISDEPKSHYFVGAEISKSRFFLFISLWIVTINDNRVFSELFPSRIDFLIVRVILELPLSIYNMIVVDLYIK